MNDTNLFFEMSPNYEVIFKENKIEGESASGGGTNPKWETEHTLESEDKSGIVTFTFLNDSDLLGQADIDFASLLAMGADGEGWIDMKDHCGKFQLTITAHEEPAAEEQTPEPANKPEA